MTLPSMRGHRGRGLLLQRRFLLHGQVPDLRAVAVHDDNPPAGVEHVVDGGGHGCRVGHHLVIATRLARPGQGVAAERDDRDLRHGILLARGTIANRIDDESFIIVNTTA
jgi:hypothetical protein